MDAPGSPCATVGELPATEDKSAAILPATGAAGSAISTASTGANGGSRLPKKQLMSCDIEAHTIQKCPSPKKKTLDPLRYMPERTSYYALFAVVARFEDHVGEYHAQRSYKQFETLHSQLQKKFPKSKLPKELPSIRKKRFDDQYIEQKSVELNEYLRQLFLLAEVKHSKILRDFLEECPQSEESEDDGAAPTKMLDGLPGTIVRVRAGQSFSVSLRLLHAGDVASWQFTTKKHNIGFSATFNGETAHVYSREESQIKPVKGSFTCTEPGTLALDWDNTYTWSKTKMLIYWAKIEQARAHSLSEIDLQGDATALNSSSVQSVVAADAVPMLDARHSGYIAQSRNSALYPRQIMNTSLSLITKPFIWGKSMGSPHAPFKSGSLIVERNFKFRGRNWYRKWFVLDTGKCVLRYYDSEQASRKGLSLATMNLATKNVCLAITSNDVAAPTPYLFMVRARKRCWKMCASSQEEYNEWEHAISTAILTAQLRKRSQKRSKSLYSKKNADKNRIETGNGHDGLDDESEDDEEDDDDEEEEEEGDGGDGDGDGKEEEEDEDSGDEDDYENENETDGPHRRDSGESGARAQDETLTRPHIELLTEKSDTSPVEPETVPEPASSLAPVPAPLMYQHVLDVGFCEYWIGELRGLSNEKKWLLMVWLNAFLYSLHSSTSIFDISTILVVNVYLALHALERPRRNRSLSLAKG